MKITYRIPHPKDPYAFVEVVDEKKFELDGHSEYLDEIRETYDRLKSEFQDGQGVGMKKLAQILHEYCTTGGIVDGGNYDFSANEKLLLGEIKKLLRNKKQ